MFVASLCSVGMFFKVSIKTETTQIVGTWSARVQSLLELGSPEMSRIK